MKILAISGSLRSASSNTTILRAISNLVSLEHQFSLFSGIGYLPHFNPDLDTEPSPKSVAHFREQLSWADLVAISTPEYAHGIPGSLKNALDWVVGSGELVGKPIGLINLSAPSTFAQASLIEILTVMSAKIVPRGCIALSLPRRSMTVEEIVGESEITSKLKETLCVWQSQLAVEAVEL